MKKTIHGTLMLLCILLSIKGNAQNVTALYDFSAVTNMTGRIDPSPVPIFAGVTFGSFTATSTLSANSSGGGRFSFSLWDIGAINGSNSFTGAINLNKYYEVILTPGTNYTLDLDSITFTLQRSSTGVRQYVVRSSIDGFTNNLSAFTPPANGNLQVVATNVFQVADASTTAENGSKIILTGFTNLSTPVTFRFYGFNAESTGGTFSIDNVRLFGLSKISATAPNIMLATSDTSFPATAIGGSGSMITYTLSGNNLTGPVALSTSTSNYTLADNASGPFSNTISIPAAELGSPKTIFVKFIPAATGTFKDTIVHSSPGAANKKLALTGDGINAVNLAFNFNACANGGVPGDGFSSYSVSGAQVWACTTFGRNNSNGVNINGFSSGAQENEDWLISPPLQISNVNLPVLRYWSKGEFSGPSLELLVSTNYSGAGDPNVASWTVLDGGFPPYNATWKLSDGIDLTAYKGFPNVYIAFKYKSSAEEGAARWSIDDVDVTNRTNLLSTNIEVINFGETSVGTNSEAKRISVRAIGYGDVTITAPTGYQLSLDSTNYAPSLTFPEATITNLTDLFVRFSPTSKQLKIEGKLRFTGTGLDSSRVQLSGTSYPKSETFDAGCYNLSFFGSNPTNNPTAAKIALQVTNITTVFNRLKLDIAGIEEVSNEVAMDSLVSKLANHKYVLSPRWSYSFDLPDPNFPPQKVGFLYDSVTSVLVDARAMFTGLYDSVRNGFPEKLPLYPGGSPQSFWASGRLPYMGTFDVTIQGVTKRVRMVAIHAKSASDAGSYNRRVYDVKVLKDSLDAYYANDLVMIVGDYNDRVSGSIYTSSPNSPYKPFVDDANYNVLTFPLDVAGRVSFIGGTGLIDHIAISNELNANYISTSTDIEDPRSYISSYNATTASDHLPVYSRFNFAAVVPVALSNLSAVARGSNVLVKWQTASEQNSSHFIVEKSKDAINFSYLTKVNAVNALNGAVYEAIDSFPVAGRNFYRLRQVDYDGRVVYSPIVSVAFGGTDKKVMTLFPNPVVNIVSITSNSPSEFYVAKLMNSTGQLTTTFKGSLFQINQQLNNRLLSMGSGIYIIHLSDGTATQNLKFIKN